jgi:hypothetical protein
MFSKNDPVSREYVRCRKTAGDKPYYATIYGFGSFGTGVTRDEAIECCLRRARNEQAAYRRRAQKRAA